MPVSNQFQKRANELKSDMVSAIKSFIGNRKIDLEATDNAFSDESDNNLVAVDKDGVYFNDGADTYPLYQLGINDAIFLVGVLEEEENLIDTEEDEFPHTKEIFNNQPDQD